MPATEHQQASPLPPSGEAGGAHGDGGADGGGCPALLAMISGGGRTLANLLEAIDQRRLHARVAAVVASRPCPGLAIAQGRGLPTLVEPGDIPARRLCELLRWAGAQWVVLCGYLRRVAVPEGPPDGCDLRGRVVNIHPALLPRHGGVGMYGMRVHEAVLASGDTHSGCTVHLCDQRYDTGPIVAQARCPVLASDTPQALADRVFGLECELYPRALADLLARQPVPPTARAQPKEQGDG